ncbi:MAG: hypothetical protein RRZ67_00875 [Victivallaceae bacterium]
MNEGLIVTPLVKKSKFLKVEKIERFFVLLCFGLDLLKLDKGKTFYGLDIAC